MAIFRNLRVRLRFESSKYFNVFLRLKSSPSLTLQKISHSRTASYVSGKLLSPVIKTEFVHVLSPQDCPKVLPLLIPSGDHSAGNVLAHRLNEMCPSEQ